MPPRSNSRRSLVLHRCRHTFRNRGGLGTIECQVLLDVCLTHMHIIHLCHVCDKVQACSLTHAWLCALDPDALGFGCVKVKRRYAELAVQRHEHSATTVGASEGGQSKDTAGDTSFQFQNQSDSNRFMTTPR